MLRWQHLISHSVMQIRRRNENMGARKFSICLSCYEVVVAHKIMMKGLAGDMRCVL